MKLYWTETAIIAGFTLRRLARLTRADRVLWAVFSWDWLKKVHSVGSFFFELYGANYICAALLFMIIASAVSFLVDSAKPPRLGPDGKPTDPVFSIIGGRYARIVII